MDECSELKNASTQVNTIIQWMDAAHHILVSVTPIPNGVDDQAGSMPFIQSKDAETCGLTKNQLE